MSTFEEKYRKRNPGAETAPAASPAIETLKSAASTEKEEYKAYSTSAHPELELWVRPNAANEFADVSLPYSYRNHMMTDGNGFAISMHFNTPIISVRLHGRNLGELFQKLLRHEVVWVMEFDPRKWATPPDDAPCITGVDIRHKPLSEKDTDTLPGEKNEPEKAAKH